MALDNGSERETVVEVPPAGVSTTIFSFPLAIRWYGSVLDAVVSGAVFGTEFLCFGTDGTDTSAELGPGLLGVGMRM